ncbi:MAG: hypothetical protein J0I41_00430 [Filimonas sp.]|nr:hypothetical protein [Filimonas sp.]
MEMKDGKLAVYAKTRSEWRKWLSKNGTKEKSVWLILFHQKSDMPGVDRIAATEEALCYGWIDSLCKKRDAESYYLTFSPRNVKRNNWSKINMERAARLIEAGKMTKRGQSLIDLAKEKGKWMM